MATPQHQMIAYVSSIQSLVDECQQALEQYDNNEITLNDLNFEIFNRMEDIESDAQRLNADLKKEINWEATDD
tara:strand:+ start:493 stop:711 length:219 start_codon:yes stop_codon:yes gene_type:complete